MSQSQIYITIKLKVCRLNKIKIKVLNKNKAKTKITSSKEFGNILLL